MDTIDNIKAVNKTGREENYYYAKQKAIVYNENNVHYNFLLEFEQELRNNSYSNQNIYQNKRQAIYFLDFLEKEGIDDLGRINKDIVLNYMKSYPSYYRKQTIKNKNKHLRIILRYLYNNKIISKDLSILVPTIKISKNSSVPSVWNENEIKLIFDNIDLNNKFENELYLVLLLAIRYGIRVSDIINLKFENIDWKNKMITLIQSKNSKKIIVPLLPEISSALVDYIKNFRPTSNEKYIFLTNDGQKRKQNNYRRILEKVLNRTNINYKNRKRGVHSMRHTLASLLLKKNTPLPIISTILGHSNTSSATIYAKVDKAELIKCCLTLREVRIDD